jgi:hypothetical protein
MKAIELKFAGIFATVLPPRSKYLCAVAPSIQPVDAPVRPPENQRTDPLAKLDGLGASD